MASYVDLSAELTTTRNRTNYARLYRLIMEGGTKTLRELFDTIIPPPTLASYLSQPEIKQKLQDLRSIKRNKRPAVIRNNEWNILYPAPLHSVSSANFDITLLMILFKSICPLKQPRSGWDSQPSSKDQSMEADIVRIKLSRNELAHGSSTNISDWHFEQKWKEISDALVRRGANRRDIDRLKTESMDSEVNAESIEVISDILDKITDPVSRCERHDRNVDNYCETCKMLICEECESGDDHKYHGVVLLKVAAHSLFGELQSGDEELHSRGDKVAVSIKDAMHCSKKLEKQFTERKESLLKSKSEENDHEIDEFLDKLTSQYDEIQTNVKSELEILQQTEEDIRQAIRLIKDVFMKENDVQFLFHGKGALSTVNTALSKPCHFESTKHDILYLPDFTEGAELVFPALPSNSSLECKNEDKRKQIGETVWFAVYTRNYAGKSVRN
ncbi:E3 ubiquitin-protein ligase DZIP3-like [Ptychodera flava]|uniref:E3 ubiquitin-protein ligase DZIP3-like n=1 Tax=Ptychodera flava TaxID=63121 RepID=UPI00396A3D95